MSWTFRKNHGKNKSVCCSRVSEAQNKLTRYMGLNRITQHQKMMIALPIVIVKTTNEWWYLMKKKQNEKGATKKALVLWSDKKKRGHLDLVLGSIIAECAYTFSYAKSSVCMWFVYMFYFLCDFRFLSLFLIGSSSSSSLYRICERLPFKAAFQVTFVSCVSWAQTRDLAAFQL